MLIIIKVQVELDYNYKKKDKEILEKFQEDLGLDGKIIYNIRPNSTCCSVEFTDEQIYNDLAKYNIIPNKTYLINHIPYQKIPKKYRKHGQERAFSQRIQRQYFLSVRKRGALYICLLYRLFGRGENYSRQFDRLRCIRSR